MANFQIATPVGRIVQGDPYTGFQNTDDNDKPKFNDDGTPDMTYMISLALDKTNPEVLPFLQAVMAEARNLYPQCHDAQGNITHPGFSLKILDGDTSVDGNGKANNTKTGWKGHYILKIAGKFPIKCYTRTNQELAKDTQSGDQIYRGCYVTVGISVQPNGWKPGDKSKPGIKVYPQAVRFVGHGEPITGGPDVATMFADADKRFIPAGMSATPLASSNPPPAAMSLPGTMTLPGAVAAPLALAPATAPQYVTVEPVAQGQPLEAWTAAHSIDVLLANGIIKLAPAAPALQPLGALPQLQPALALQPAALTPAPLALTVATPAPNFTANALQAQPQYVMNPALSQGATREQWNAQGYDDAKLLAAGVMTQV